MIRKQLWLLLTVSLGCVSGQDIPCHSMLLYQATYNNLRAKAEEMSSLVSQMMSKIDGNVDETCGNHGKPAVAYAFNLTICDFEQGNCGYDRSVSRNSWSRINPYRDYDHTTGSSIGHLLESYHYSSSYNSTAVSLPFKAAASYCIRFFYRTVGPGTYNGSFNVYLMEGNGLGHPVWHQNHIKPNWTMAEISPDPEYLKQPFQIVFQEQGEGYVYVDDIIVYDTHCNTTGVREPICPDGAFRRTDGRTTKCYTFREERLNWTDATRACKKIWPLSTLVTLETMREDAFIRTIIQNNTAMTRAADFGIWTAGNDIAKESNYTWPSIVGDPEPFTYSNWHRGQPNNIGGDQDCVVLEYPLDGIRWGDVSCSEKHSYICEADYGPGAQVVGHHSATIRPVFG